jgi:DNA-binding HxlR family transcriptional regulator
MSRRNYDQYCALAKALDVVGERWTLLLVRELFAGPQRFSDLLQTLPGIGNGLLSTRLREMQEAGLIEVTELPAPAATRVYQLTESGRRLDEAVTALGRWGASFLGPPGATLHHHPLWLLQSLAAHTRRSSANTPGLSRLDIDIQLDGQRHHLRLRSGRVIAGRGPHHEPQACITTTSETLYALSRRQTQIEDAMSEGKLEVSGDHDAAMRALQALVFSEPSDGKETP